MKQSVERLGDVSLPACKQGPIVLVYRGWASYVVCVERDDIAVVPAAEEKRKEMEGIENGKPEVKRLPACIRRGCIGLKTHYGVTAVCSSMEEQHDWKHHQEGEDLPPGEGREFSGVQLDYSLQKPKLNLRAKEIAMFSPTTTGYHISIFGQLI